MKIFNKKYHYILPLLCVASFSAQATYSEEQETSYRARLLKAPQNVKFNAGFDEAREKDSVLKGMEISLMHDKSALEENEERLIKCPNRPEYLKSVQNWRKIVQEKQTQINLRIDFLMKKYKEDCDSRQLSLITSSSPQTSENIHDKTKSYKKIEMSNYNLLDIPIETLHLIASFLPTNEKGSFRQTSSFIKEKIFDEAYKSNLKKRFINSASTALEDVLTDMPETAVSPFKDYLLQAACEDYLDKDGFLTVIQGSLLEGYLNRNYASVPLYGYLKDQSASAKKLFKILFDRELPEAKYELALNLLCGCLPSNHIYVKNGIEDASPLLKKFSSALLKSIKGDKRKYFLWGIDEDLNILKDQEHIIVINQSNQENLHKLEDFPYSTVIYNADQEVLNSPYDLLKKMKKLILVNGNNQCLSTLEQFFYKHNTLQVCSAKGLGSVKKIGFSFLAGCSSLSAFEGRGLSNVNEIKDSFLSHCHNLSRFDSAGLNNVRKINYFFLANCKKLTNFNSEGFISVEEIIGYFLYNCTSLSNFDGKGFIRLQRIKDNFLNSCTNLSNFKLHHVQEIGEGFLDGTKLDGYKIEKKLLKKKK